jgi:hypothetical protein
MSLACWDNFALSREVVRSYRQAGGDDTPIEPSDLGQPLMIGLDWVAFNVERGHRASARHRSRDRPSAQARA